MKSHYELLGIDQTADVETIKKAFRREIALYHPDKVTHLGHEFQQMAAARAAELTAAYKVLTDADMRAEYDASLLHSRSTPAVAETGPPPPPPPADDAETEPEEAADAGSAAAADRFEQERAGRDDIMRRAVLHRVLEVLQQLTGGCEMPVVKGFDLACVSKAKPSVLRRQVPPSVLVVVAPMIDAAVATEAWLNAVRARLVQRPIVILLLGNAMAPAGELSRAIDEARKKTPLLQELLFPVPIDIRDWSARIPANAPDSVRLLIDRLRNFVG